MKPKKENGKNKKDDGKGATNIVDSNCQPGSGNSDCAAPIFSVKIEQSEAKLKRKRKGKNCKKLKVATAKMEPKATIITRIDKCIVNGKKLSGSDCGVIAANPGRAKRNGSSAIYLRPKTNGPMTIRVTVIAPGKAPVTKKMRMKISGSDVCSLPGTG